ncbi:hypothetical protein BH09MYX1_BH09MYX1_21770 [soil metagenome]
MSTKQVIVAAVELDPTADQVWKLAETFLQSPDVEMHFVHVVRGSESAIRANPATASALLEEAHTNMQKWLSNRVTIQDPRVQQMRLTVALGAPAESLIRLAADVEADMILLGTHGKTGVERLVLGSTASQVFKMAPCTVVIAKEKDYTNVEKSATVEAAGRPGQAHHHAQAHTYHYHRAIPFTSYVAHLSPTGISRDDVH